MEAILFGASCGAAFIAVVAAAYVYKSHARVLSIEDAIYKRLDREYEFQADGKPAPIPEPTVSP